MRINDINVRICLQREITEEFEGFSNKFDLP